MHLLVKITKVGIQVIDLESPMQKVQNILGSLQLLAKNKFREVGLAFFHSKLHSLLLTYGKNFK